MILVGSKAIKYWFPDFPREPKDTDYITDELPIDKDLIERKADGRVEFLINPVFEDYPCYSCKSTSNSVLSPNKLYTLKMSHTVGWKLENNSWDKHLWDITWLQKKGCKLDYPLFYRLYNYWETFHGKNKRSDLEMSAKEFFDNALTCEYSHDWLHTLIQETPTYTKVLKDGAEVEVSEEKFKQLSEDEKENLVREEVMIMAFERWPDIGYMHSYHRMLKKFVIGHAPLWEAIWILENWVKLHKAKFNFIKYLNEKINERGNNIVKRSTRSILTEA